ncbi:endoglucanase-like [Cylas formicarius]|uniref:endoglucanase-like n=1 Tax=Cylas formicarius TaxID=197179 RepID=UPI002958D14A|nr:endoglucanase-like [Cylas formicarius]
MKTAFLITFGLFMYLKSSSSVTLTPVPGGANGYSQTTRYWDCCKPTCSWVANIQNKKSPVDTCGIDGVTIIDKETQSGCGDGAGYVCNDAQPWALNDSFAFGFIAGTFENAPMNMCCECLLLKFQPGGWGQDLTGKQMVVQIINTGDTSSTTGQVNEFDVHIPGGGVGYFTEGCKKQWNAPETGWGDQYGGVEEESGCYDLPQQLQPGCLFRWSWMGGASNPPVNFEQVECPQELIAKSHCS